MLDYKLGFLKLKKAHKMTEATDTRAVVALAAEIVATYVSNNTVVVSELPAIINDVCEALRIASAKSVQPHTVELIPAVSIKKSVTPDYIICLDDGKRFKSLKRHIRTCYGLSPEEYREKWGLPYDYPMVAPNYAASRSALAKKMGLGRRRK
jgi:predicted transcriptional regulator